MFRLFAMLTVAALVVVTAVPVRAADEPKKKKTLDVAETFKKLDTNSDKKLSKEEFTKFTPPQKKVAAEFKADEAFEKLDADKNGSLSEDEFKKITEVAKKKKAK